MKQITIAVQCPIEFLKGIKYGSLFYAAHNRKIFNLPSSGHQISQDVNSINLILTLRYIFFYKGTICSLVVSGNVRLIIKIQYFKPNFMGYPIQKSI